MLMKNTIFLRIILVIFIFNLCLFNSAFANNLKSNWRSDIITHQLDCISNQRSKKDPILWEDICAVENIQIKENPKMSEDIINDDRDITSYETIPIIVNPNENASGNDLLASAEEDIFYSDEHRDGGFSSESDASFKNDKKKKLEKYLSRDNPLNKIEVGFDFFRFIYEEPGLMKDQGNMYGFYGAYTYRTSENKHISSWKDVFSDTNKINMYKAELRINGGEADYKSEGTGSIEDIEYRMLEVRGLVGYDIPVKNNFRITPYLGFGYQYLNDDTGGRISTSGHSGYERENKCFYMPVGFETEAKLVNNWSTILKLEYDIFLDGQQISHLEDVGLMYRDSETGETYVSDPIKNEQYEGYGLKAACKLVKKNETFDFFIEPFVSFWEKENSDPTQATSQDGKILWYHDEARTMPVWYVEPKNTNTEYGVKLGLMF